jgi:hypothetical protein
MKISSLARYAICVIAAGAIFAGCSSNGSSPGSMVPGSSTGAAHGVKLPPAAHRGQIMTTVPKWAIKVGPYHPHHVPASFTRGIATQEFFATSSNVLVFPKNNSANGPPTCSNSTGSNVNDLDSDGSGNLIVPNAFSGVLVYAPPFTASSCGTLLGTITEAYGQASSSAAIDAVNGTIVVGNIGGGTSTGVVTCTLSSLTCTALSSPNMSTLAGVAMDKSGNCYADAFSASTGLPTLWVYTGCTGTGVPAAGFSEPYYGGIDVDNKGNLVVVSLFNSSFTTPSTVTTYSGCATGTCTVVSGPTALAGESVFGHLGRQNERFATADITTSSIEVYSYKPATGLGSMLYSFTNGLSCLTNLCETAAYMPHSPK